MSRVTSEAVDRLAEWIYAGSLIADRPRVIDRYIDYFGEGPARAASLRKPSASGAILTRCE